MKVETFTCDVCKEQITNTKKALVYTIGDSGSELYFKGWKAANLDLNYGHACSAACAQKKLQQFTEGK